MLLAFCFTSPSLTLPMLKSFLPLFTLYYKSWCLSILNLVLAPYIPSPEGRGFTVLSIKIFNRPWTMLLTHMVSLLKKTIRFSIIVLTYTSNIQKTILYTKHICTVPSLFAAERGWRHHKAILFVILHHHNTIKHHS